MGHNPGAGESSSIGNLLKFVLQIVLKSVELAGGGEKDLDYNVKNIISFSSTHENCFPVVFIWQEEI